MTEEQQRFFNMLMPFHRFRHHWNQLDQSLDVQNLKQDLKLMNSGEQNMAKFFAYVWLGESKTFPFDVLDALSDLDSKSWNIVCGWLKEPFFP